MHGVEIDTKVRMKNESDFGAASERSKLHLKYFSLLSNI